MKVKNATLKLTLAVFMISAPLAQAQDAGSAYSFGEGCSSQGLWTQKALEQTKTISKAIEDLKNDKNCSGITNYLSSFDLNAKLQALQNPGGDTGKAQEVSEAMPGDMAALQAAVASDPNIKNEASSLLVKKIFEKLHLESKLSSIDYKQKAKVAGSVALEMIDGVIAQLPGYTTCLANRPDAGAMLLGGVISLAGTISSTNKEGMISRTGRIIQNLVKVMRDQNFAVITQKLNQSEYWSSISCLMEATAENYCAVKDAYEMIKYTSQAENLEKKIRAEGLRNPLEGYYIMEREVAIVTDWLQRLQFGVVPRTKAVAQEKNSILDNMNNYWKDYNKLMSAYNFALIQLESFPSQETKRNQVYQLVVNMAQEMMTSDGYSYFGEGAGNPINFFTNTVKGDLIPYYLIGLDSIPPEQRASKEVMFVKEWSEWMRSGGKEGGYVDQFNDPDLLMKVLGSRLNAILEKALISASGYFRKMFIVDIESLINETAVSQTINVYDSLVNMDRYLSNVLASIPRDQSKMSIADRMIPPSIYQTQLKIREVLYSFEQLMKLGGMYLGAKPEDVFAHISQDLEWARQNKTDIKRVNTLFNNTSFKESYAKIIDSAFMAFNVLLQRDSFFAIRMGTIVRYDFTNRIKKNTGSSYQNDLLIISGKQLLDRFKGAQGFNLEEAKADLSNAQIINGRNLSALEEMFGPTIMSIATEYKLVSQSNITLQGIIKERDQNNAYGACIRYATDKKLIDYSKNSTYQSCIDYATKDGFSRFLISFGASQTPYTTISPIIEFSYYLAQEEQKNNSAFEILLDQGRRKKFTEIYEDTSDSHQTQWAKFCTQSLMFNNPGDMAGICRGAVLGSISENKTEEDFIYAYNHRPGSHPSTRDYASYVRFVESEKSSSYNGNLFRFLTEKDLKTKLEWREQNVCAYRSHLRRNYVYWLTKYNNQQTTDGVLVNY